MVSLHSHDSDASTATYLLVSLFIEVSERSTNVFRMLHSLAERCTDRQNLAFGVGTSHSCFKTLHSIIKTLHLKVKCSKTVCRAFRSWIGNLCIGQAYGVMHVWLLGVSQSVGQRADPHHRWILGPKPEQLAQISIRSLDDGQ